MNAIGLFLQLILTSGTATTQEKSLIVSNFSTTPAGDSLPKYGIYLSERDFIFREPKFGYSKRRLGTQIRPGLMNMNNLHVNAKDTSFVLKDGEYWGYRRYDTDYRISSGGAYEIESVNDGLHIYKQIHFSETGSSVVYYFSKELNSKIFRLSRKNLKKHYQNDKKFLENLKLTKWPLSLVGQVPPNHELRIVALYKLTHNSLSRLPIIEE